MAPVAGVMYPMIPHLELYNNTDGDWPSEACLERFRNALQQLLPELLAVSPGPDHVLSQLEEVEISVVDDPAIAQVHAEFLHDPNPTDVITFPYGEILVSCDTATRYADEHALSREEELFRYMVHGLTHLHGYLDGTPEERAVLFAVQEPLVFRFFPK